ncbi:peptidoglycan DD-metalloendopeptidase family protein [Tolypothrix bouteillei VB521301]|uniref:Peptidoglycan DD-metalloendopeptidase family protein n=1 Tax=Tolypothrix bouteillei VB521301 TaxID=1479485 RepID=A0A8S9TGJ7_9CYAN|nr:peptidoglycan DD-metalloendopeptidase family protein [Tolypothrix bouteillei VB521301]
MTYPCSPLLLSKGCGEERICQFIFILAVFCILCISLIFIPVQSDAATTEATYTINTLRQQQQMVDQQRQSVTQERQRLNNLQEAAQNRLNGLEQNLQTTDVQIQDSEFRLQRAIQRLQQLQADLATAEVSYQQRQEATIARLRFLQRNRLSQGWGVLLQSQDLNDFLDRRRQLKLVYKADQQVLAKLTKQANRLNAQKIQVEEQRNEIGLIRQQLYAQKADYQTQAQLQEELIQRLSSDRLALAAAESQLERDSQALKSLIQQKVAEEEERLKTNSRNSVIIRGTGIFAYPSSAPTSSPFGWRMHPVLGYRRFHAGLDFAASYGSTIRAADSGTVIFAGWYGGYGRAVIINHGNGITTLYGHTSELFVSEGQTVERGQAIAAVGSTGLSTGPHLHFEVRKNGTPVNPMNFL